MRAEPRCVASAKTTMELIPRSSIERRAKARRRLDRRFRQNSAGFTFHETPAILRARALPGPDRFRLTRGPEA